MENGEREKEKRVGFLLGGGERNDKCEEKMNWGGEGGRRAVKKLKI